MRLTGYFTFLVLVIFLFGKEGNAQCVITASGSPTTLPCGGGTVNLTAAGSGFTTTLLDNNFDGGNAGPGWNVSPAAQFDNPCDPSFDGNTYMWMGSSTAAPRTLETVAMDVSCGGDICFYLDFATQGASSPCEGPDLTNEGVFFEYSVNGGATWTTINYFQPNPGTGAFTSWAQYCFTIPPGAQTTSTIFQWFQGGSSGGGFDHWGIDNVTITAQNCGSAWLDWDNIPGTVGPGGDPASQTVNVTSSTTFTVCYTDGGLFNCCETVSITVQGAVITATASATDASCFGGCTGTVSATGAGGTAPYIYSWSGLGIGQNQTSVCPGTYTVTVTDANGCIGTATVDVLQPNPIDLFAIPLDESCAGACDGLLFASVTGGVGPFTFTWNNGIGVGQSQSNICPGTYTVTVVDANGCTEQNTFSSTTTINAGPGGSAGFTYNGNQCVTGNSYLFTNTGSTGATYSWNFGDGNTSTLENPSHVYAAAGTYTVTQTVTSGPCSAVFSLTVVVYPEPTASIVGIDVSCAGACDGTATLTPVGGTGPYTYAWSNLATTQNLSGLCAGSYTVTISDANNCTGTATVVIGTPAVLTVGVVGTDILCNGSCTGTATATPSGGTAPYTYSWNDPGFQVTATANALCTGTVVVTVTDAGGCTATGSYTVQQPAAMVLTLSAVNSSCGLSDGSTSVSVVGGLGPYTYLWSSGCVTASCPGLPSGSYTLQVTDANGCTASGVISVNDAGGGGVASAIVNNHATCFGVCDGQATASITGGTTPFTYLWSDPGAQASPVAIGLCAGTFSVSITDGIGCTSTASVTVTEPPLLNATVTSSTGALCFGSCNGSATVSASGGTGTYTYSWNNPGASTVATTSLDLCAGTTYTVTVTDASGCAATATVVITEPPLLTATIVGANALCNGGSTGAANLTPAGGISPYNFLWSTGDVTEDLSNLSAGTYTVTVTDLNLCTATASVVISEPAALVLSTTVVDASCGLANGSSCVTPTGGTGPYTYIWSDSLNQITTCAATLPGGSFSVTVTDNNGCSGIATVTVNNLPGGNAVATLVSNTSGFGICDGSASATLTSGTLPYTYIWDDPVAQITSTAVGLCAGVYCVTVTDAVGCTSSDCITITQPPAITTVVSGVNLLCNSICNGSATLSLSGGIAPFSFVWTGGFTTQNIAGLCAGTYYVTVTDANSVSVLDSIDILEPAPLVLTTVGTDAVCNNVCDGTATVSPTGGTGAVTYLWNDPAGQTTATAMGLCAGTYDITATDANGCTSIATYTINEPPPLIVAVTNIDANCGQADGSVIATTTNGIGPFNYQWNTICASSTCTGLVSNSYDVTVTDASGCVGLGSGAIADLSGPTAVMLDSVGVTCSGGVDGQATVIVNDGVPPYSYSWNTSPSETTPTATGLPAGPTILTITDVNGCVTAIGVQIGEPTPVVVSTTFSNPSCNSSCNGFVTAVASGGTGAYTYLWNDPGTQTTMSASMLCAGTFGVNVEDANGCSTMGSVTITDPAILVLSVNSADAFCGGSCDGSAAVTAFGGTTPYSYSWNTSPMQTTQVVGSLCASTYTITTTDANGCTASSTTIVNEPGLLVATIGSSGDVSCNGSCDGFAQSAVSGGVVPYTYAWSNSLTTDQVTNICAGIYDLTVTDANGCSAITAVTISSPSALVGNMTQQNISCNGACDGVATVAVSGGVLPYTYLWNDIYLQNTFSADSLCGGSFIVTITDLNGCSITRTVNITEPQPLSFIGTTMPSTCGDKNGSACVSVVGGIVPYTIVWNDPAVTIGVCVDSVFAGVYNPVLTDGNACVFTIPVIINDITGPIIDSIPTTDLACFGDASGTATVIFSGGTFPFAFTWRDGNGLTIGTGSSFISSLSGGTFTVTIVDFNGCTFSQIFSINEPLQIVSAINGSTDVSCFGACDGSASVVVGNGTLPYTYSWSPSTSTLFNPVGLCGGLNNVLITDANGCQTFNSVTLNEPAALVISSTMSNVSCNASTDGQISVTSSGGMQPYTYLWLPGGSGTGTMANNLGAGSYTAQVTDNNFCTTNAVIVITEPPMLMPGGSSSPSSCGDPNGEATASASGGTAPLSYEWFDSQSAPLGQNTITATGLLQGTYDVVTTDANGCSVTLSIPVTNNVGPTISSPSSSPVLCYGGADGSATIFPNGGTLPYTYLWDDIGAQTNAQATGLTGGTYAVTLTDLNGCIDTASMVVFEPLQVIVQMSNDTSICIGGTAIIGVAAIGGTNELGGVNVYSYAWDNGIPDTAGAVVNPNSQTTYNVTVTDVNGCPATGSVVVSLYPALTVSVNDETICSGDIATLVATVSGGNPNNSPTFSWAPGGSTSSSITVSPTAPLTTYTVSVDDQGCSPGASNIATVTVNELPIVGFSWACDPDPSQLTFTDTTTAPSGASLDTWNWDFGDQNTSNEENPTHDYAASQVYIVTLEVITDQGCSASTSTPVESPPTAEFIITQNGAILDPPETSILSPIVDFVDASSADVVWWYWAFGDGDSTTVLTPDFSGGDTMPHTYTEEGMYNVLLMVQNQTGCFDTVIHPLTIKGDFVLFTPNTFTPNGDGKNDYFFPQGIGVDEETFTFFVYDRWGDLVFESSGVFKDVVGWDGHANNGKEPSQLDVYVWLIRTEDQNGDAHQYVGHVTLLR